MLAKLRWTLGLGLIAITGVAGTATAAADGLPVPFDGGDNAGVPTLDGDLRYSTVASGTDTVAVKVLAGTGEIQRTAQLRGDWGVPLVAYDGTPSGLSADGERLILIQPRTRFPRERTTFAYIDTDNMRIREQLTLEGDYSFDALSPDGSTMYLIEYLDPRDPTAYEVRAYDLERGRLLPDPIIDPSEPDEEMFGFPQTRAVSPDGRWHYTLYETVGNHHPPFIHALDAESGTAVCIDLDALADHRDVFRLGLTPTPDGSTLDVVDRGNPIASVDLATFEVSEPAAPAAAATPSANDGNDVLPWIAIAGGGALLVCALLLLRGRRHRGEDSADEREQVDQLERLVAAENGAGEREHEHDPVR